MGLILGTRIGPYEVVSMLGAGGMGEVYRARDTRLKREVALKILPDSFATDPDRRARFQREAEVLGALNHPNIAAIHGLEESNDIRALVMELVEGETLADRIANGPIRLEEALPIAKQIAEALEAAHEQGIIHRDLKPANIRLRPDGTVKVLDFGLAKLAETHGTPAAVMSNSPTLTSPAMTTGVGMLLGTAGYMSPEQARAKVVDKRADIWAFGCVLYEMITGRRAFGSDGASDRLAVVITKDPDWTALPGNTPSLIRKLLRRCLEKDRRRRFADIADVRLEIDEALTTPSGDASAAPVDGPPPSWRRALPWALASGLGVGLVLVVVMGSPWRRVSPPTSLRLSAGLGADASLVTEAGRGAAAILSPDGTVLAFIARSSATGRSQVYVRRLEQLQAVPLAGTDGAHDPFFSPDGQSIAFFAGDKLKKISVTGGAAVTLCDAPNGGGGSWAEDGTIAFVPNTRPGATLMRVSSAGGTSQALTTLDQAEVSQRWPQMLPGGRAVLYTGHSRPNYFDDANLVVQPLPTGERKVVQRGGYYGRYVLSGHLVYIHDGTLFAAPFDLDRLEVTGPPVPALEDVAATPFIGAAQFAMSGNGTLVYVPSVSFEAPIQWMDRDGNMASLLATAAKWTFIEFSPDGRRLAMDISDGKHTDVWVYEWARNTLSRLTFDSADNRKPVWTPDGSRIVFSSNRADKTSWNLYWQRADATGEVQRLTDSKNRQFAGSWHPSGKFLAFHESNLPSGTYRLMVLPMEGTEASVWKPGTPTVVWQSSSEETQPMFSPDGRWLAYASSTGSVQAEGSKWQISTGGGMFPKWSRTRKELLFSPLAIGG